MSTSEINLFSAVRRLQPLGHPCGKSTHEAFTSGRCHVLAYALQDAMGGEIVVATPPHDRSFLVHAAVHKDGIVSDGSGHTASGAWAEMWRHMAAEPDLEFRRASRAEVDAMMAHRPATKDEVEMARPYAAALVAARGIDPRVWRAPLPYGANAFITKESALDPQAAFEYAKGLKPLPTLPPVAFKEPFAAPGTLKLFATKAEVDEARDALAGGPRPWTPMGRVLHKLAHAIAQPLWIRNRAGQSFNAGRTVSGKDALDQLAAGFGKQPTRTVTLDAIKVAYGVEDPSKGLHAEFETAKAASIKREAESQKRRAQQARASGGRSLAS